jgi:prepilin-type N-terminal cleavage/methylation domain-containing protein
MKHKIYNKGFRFQASRRRRGSPQAASFKLQGKKGFTLIELLVAMTIFLIVTAIVSTVFMKSLRTQKNITALIAANDNASAALEQMTREIRTGRNFCNDPEPCALDDDSGVIIFTNAHNDRIVYRLNGSKIEKQENSNFSYPLTADNITVKRLRFHIIGNGSLLAGNADSLPTRISIMLGIEVGFVGASTEISVANLQTTVTARTFDN